MVQSNRHNSATSKASGGYAGSLNKSPNFGGGWDSGKKQVDPSLRQALAMAAYATPGYVEAASGNEVHTAVDKNGRRRNTGNHDRGVAADVGIYGRNGAFLDNGTNVETAPAYRSLGNMAYDALGSFDPQAQARFRAGTSFSNQDNMHYDLNAYKGYGPGGALNGLAPKAYSAPSYLNAFAAQSQINNRNHPELANSLLSPDTTAYQGAKPNPSLGLGDMDMLSPRNFTDFGATPSLMSRIASTARKYDPISGAINATNTLGGILGSVLGRSQPALNTPQDVPSAASMGTRPNFPGSPTPLSAYGNRSFESSPLSAPQSTASNDSFGGNPARTMGATPSSMPSYGMTGAGPTMSYSPGVASAAMVSQAAPSFKTVQSINPAYTQAIQAQQQAPETALGPDFNAQTDFSAAQLTPGSFEQAFAPQIQRPPVAKLPPQYITRRVPIPQLAQQMARQAPAQQAPAAPAGPDYGTGFLGALEAINSGRNITGNGAYETSNSNAYGPTTYGTQSFQGGDHSTLGGGDGHRAL